MAAENTKSTPTGVIFRFRCNRARAPQMRRRGRCRWLDFRVGDPRSLWSLRERRSRRATLIVQMPTCATVLERQEQEAAGDANDSDSHELESRHHLGLLSDSPTDHATNAATKMLGLRLCGPQHAS